MGGATGAAPTGLWTHTSDVTHATGRGLRDFRAYFWTSVRVCHSAESARECQLSRVCVLAQEGAETRAAGALKVVEMLPQVGGVLDPLLHGEGLVVRAHVALVEVVGQHGWPQYAAASLGRDGDAEVGEAGAAALLHIR
jgi:hypothetical protein